MIDIFKALKEAGFWESTGKEKIDREFHRRFKEGPICSCNESRPEMTVTVYPDGIIPGYKSTVSVEMFGSIADDWINPKIYGISPETFVKRIELYSTVLLSMWKKAYEEYVKSGHVDSKELDSDEE